MTYVLVSNEKLDAEINRTQREGLDTSKLLAALDKLEDIPAVRDRCGCQECQIFFAAKMDELCTCEPCELCEGSGKQNIGHGLYDDWDKIVTCPMCNGRQPLCEFCGEQDVEAV